MVTSLFIITNVIVTKLTDVYLNCIKVWLTAKVYVKICVHVCDILIFQLILNLFRRKIDPQATKSGVEL